MHRGRCKGPESDQCLSSGVSDLPDTLPGIHLPSPERHWPVWNPVIFIHFVTGKFPVKGTSCGGGSGRLRGVPRREVLEAREDSEC